MEIVVHIRYRGSPNGPPVNPAFWIAVHIVMILNPAYIQMNFCSTRQNFTNSNDYMFQNQVLMLQLHFGNFLIQ